MNEDLESLEFLKKNFANERSSNIFYINLLVKETNELKLLIENELISKEKITI